MYKIYGCESPEIVYNTLKGVGATHMIVEDSICLAPPDLKHPLCRLVDIVDLHSGHVSNTCCIFVLNISFKECNKENISA